MEHETTIRTSVLDTSDAAMRAVEVVITAHGITLRFPGYGDAASSPGCGEPVLIEYRGGVPHVVLWADITQEDPTHLVSLEGAALSRGPRPDKSPQTGDAHDLTDRELATVLAALREYQGVWWGEEPAEEDVEEIATGGGTFAALDDSEIDALCEKLNRPGAERR